MEANLPLDEVLDGALGALAHAGVQDLLDDPLDLLLTGILLNVGMRSQQEQEGAASWLAMERQLGTTARPSPPASLNIISKLI